jgi:acetyl-CoA carboxylase biotin carboxylase subunit
VKSVVVFSEADRETLAVKMADEAVCIGPAPSSESYLLIERIISVAEICDVDAIHPGYGFLAENAHFAEVCESCNIKFIGPTPEQMNAMGDKANARDTMIKAGVPITPGGDGILESEEEALKLAHQFKYPVIIKASAGGGGKGMRVAHNDASLIQGYHAAKREAEMSFGNADVYLEKFIVNPKHIEVQIMADAYGNCIHLGERDCSVQRRHQKLIEEAPSPAISEELRQRIGATAVRAAKAVNYVNAGTIEFLLGADNEFYFMEMNTRVQVEHPVTEMVTGLDIIQEQIRVAAGEKLSVTQDDINVKGHAIECRINAENPYNNFSPSPGPLNLYLPAGGPGVRIDSHVYTGYVIPPHYDSMIAKLIVYGKNRKEAIMRCRRALDEFMIEGISTSIPFTQFIINDDEFLDGMYDTGYIDRIVDKGHF